MEPSIYSAESKAVTKERVAVHWFRVIFLIESDMTIENDKRTSILVTANNKDHNVFATLI